VELSDVIQVGPFRIADVARDELLDQLVQAWCQRTRAVSVMALHVGGMNRRRDDVYVAQMNGADVCYADGAAAVLVARARGARRIQRSPTTDLAHVLLDRLSTAKDGPVSIALIGGTPGVAEQAARSLEAVHSVESVYTSHGFRTDWHVVTTELRALRPDLIFVGLGMPLEAAWVTTHLGELPPGLVLTCGGWFGFLVGAESRAPQLLQRLGAEWLWRLLQSPRRLLVRYAGGAVTTGLLCLGALASRISARSRHRSSSNP
jgi:N-acetylglucosaminyldiphosphoundecaprenol N-acetyl-beta-D-mannosaminyltransferase